MFARPCVWRGTARWRSAPTGQCPDGRDDCDGLFANGCEVELDADNENCGACGLVCEGQRATVTCREGDCALDECDDGYTDCDGFWENGCEVHTDADLQHCGGCGQLCAPQNAAAACVDGDCLFDCHFGFWDNDGDPGCEYGPCTLTGEEVCDGVDNDCDGLIDAADPDLALTEELNGLDDDCDGSIDETFDLDHDGVCVGCDGVDAVDTCPTVWNPHNGEAEVLCPPVVEDLASRPLALSEPGREDGQSSWRRTNEPVEVPLSNGIVDDSVVGLWRLNGSATDASGYGNHGVATDTATIDGPLASRAYAFDGESSSVIFPRSALLDFGPTDDFSFSIWMRTTTPDGLVFNSYDSTSQYIGLAVVGDGRLSFSMRGAGNGGGGSECRPDNVVTDGVWHHVVGVHDGHARTITVYVDGQSVCAASETEPGTFAGHPLALANDGPGRSFARIDLEEFIVWRRALSAPEISAYHSSGAPYGTGLADGAEPDLDDLLVSEGTGAQEHLIPVEVVGPHPHSDIALDGVTAYLPMDRGIAVDVTGNLTVADSPGSSIGGRFGSRDGAVRLVRGEGQGITIENTPALNTPTGTWETWLWLDAYPPEGQGHIFDKDLQAGDQDLEVFVTNEGRVLLDRESDDHRPNIAVTGDKVVPLHSWHHLAITWDGEFMTAYLDGLVEIRIEDDFGINNAAPLVIGYTTTGRLDDVLIHSAAKSADYVYNRARPGVPTVRFLAHTLPMPNGMGFDFRRYTLRWGGPQRVPVRPELVGLDQETRCDGLLSPCLGYAGWWRFESGEPGLAIDESTGRSHGELQGSPARVATPEGMGLDFAGGDRQVLVAHNPRLALPRNGSVEFHARLARGNEGVYEKGNIPGIYAGLDSSANFDILFRDEVQFVNSGIATAPLGSWASFGVTADLDGDECGSYLDYGVTLMRDCGGVESFDTSDDLRIGYQRTYPLSYFSGALDDFRLSSRALAPDELLHHPAASNGAWDTVHCRGRAEDSPAHSCRDIVEAGCADGDGEYWIDPSENLRINPFRVYCDMSTDGGGWILAGFRGGAVQDGLMFVGHGDVRSDFGEDAASGSWSLDLANNEINGTQRYLEMAVTLGAPTPQISGFAYVVYFRWDGTYQIQSNWASEYETGIFSYRCAPGEVYRMGAFVGNGAGDCPHCRGYWFPSDAEFGADSVVPISMNNEYWSGWGAGNTCGAEVPVGTPGYVWIR